MGVSKMAVSDRNEARRFGVGVADVRSASERIRPYAVRTPLLEYPSLNGRAGGRVLIKFEGAQREGSFKFRGAMNRLAALSEDERRTGVVAWSSGNHAQGVAAAAQLVGARATIVMPSDAPAVKLNNTRRLGADVVTYDRLRESREEIARQIARERGAVLVPSYDDPFVIAGQGTVGLEIAEQAETLGVRLDQLLVCCGGGGLVAGTAIAMQGCGERASIYTVEPEAFDDTARSLRAGKVISNVPGSTSICDALLAPEPGELTFPINLALLAGGLSVSDEEVRAAIKFAFERLKLVVEPGGAVALAAVLAGRIPTGGVTTAIVISGSNIDPVLFADIIGGR